MVHRLAVSFFVFMGLCSCTEADTILRLGAAASLSDVLPPLLESAEGSVGVPVEAVYGSSGELAAQMRHGADLDALFLASETAIMDLSEAGLVQASVVPRIRNRLVLAGSRGSSTGELSQLLMGAERVGIGTLGVPAGDYARAWLETEGLEPALVEFGHVRAVLACVESGSCELGFVYATDLAGRSEVVALEQWDGAPRYGFGIGSKAPDAARELADLLAEESAAFEAAGFLVEAP